MEEGYRRRPSEGREMKDLLERLRSPQNLFEQQRAEAELSGLMSDRERGFSRELELIEAKARIAELEPDAERYRWLCCSPDSWWHTWNPDAPPGLKQRVDKEIDAARVKETNNAP